MTSPLSLTAVAESPAPAAKRRINPHGAPLHELRAWRRRIKRMGEEWDRQFEAWQLGTDAVVLAENWKQLWGKASLLDGLESLALLMAKIAPAEVTLAVAHRGETGGALEEGEEVSAQDFDLMARFVARRNGQLYPLPSGSDQPMD